MKCQHFLPNTQLLINNMVRYRDLQVGQIIILHAVDSRYGILSKLRLQIVHFVHDDMLRADIPVFVLLEDFGFYQRGEFSLVLKAGSKMKAGSSMAWLPYPRPFMMVFGGISLGRDHSFDHANAEHMHVYAKDIMSIEVEDAPEGWQPPSEEDISIYLRACESLVSEAKQREAEWHERLQQPVRVVTANSVYEFGPTDGMGLRDIHKNGTFVGRGRILQADVNDLLRYYVGEDNWLCTAIRMIYFPNG
ncbi:MAG: hypothetical protein ACOYUZ_05825 [Patescibacteria group bacterium]